MSLLSMNMAETLPDAEILERFEDLEQRENSLISDYARLIHRAYHRGCLRQHARCLALIMLQQKCTFMEANKILKDPLIYGQELEAETIRHYSKFLRTKGEAKSE